MESYLPVIWAAIIGCAVAMYVTLDGFDLGIGILFPFAASERERDQMMNSVAPFWDGNETWLVLVAFAAWRAIVSGLETLPFLATIALFLLGYLGLLISNFPYIVPPSLTIWQAAAAPATQVFMLMGTLVMLPIIFGYTIFVYWIFSGKLREGEGYH